MTQPKTKHPGYLENALNEARSIILQGKDRNAIVAQIQALLEKRVLESFKNGIAVGIKKARQTKEE